MTCEEHKHTPLLQTAGPTTITFLRKFMSKKDDKMLPSHLSLSGGVFYVPDDQLPMLYKKLEMDATEGYPIHFLVENRKKVFPLLFDFDFHSLPTMGQVSLKVFCDNFVPILSSVLQEMYPQLSEWERRMVICCAPQMLKEKDCEKNGEVVRLEVRKEGFHLIFPGIFVVTKHALVIRQLVLNELKEHYKDFLLAEDGTVVDTWPQVVDMCVFTSNGLRMIGAHKAEKCKTSKACKHYVSKGRPYSVAELVYEGDDCQYTLEDLQTKLSFCLQELSMRPDHEATPYSGTFENVRVDLIPATKRVCTTKRVLSNLRDKTNNPEEDDDNEDSQFISVPFIAEKNSNMRNLQQCLQLHWMNARKLHPWKTPDDLIDVPFETHMGGAFSTLYVNCVDHKLWSEEKFVWATGMLYPKIRYCVLEEREHSSNRVYFLLKYTPELKRYVIAPRCHNNTCRRRVKEMRSRFGCVIKEDPNIVHDWLCLSVNRPDATVYYLHSIERDRMIANMEGAERDYTEPCLGVCLDCHYHDCRCEERKRKDMSRTKW